MCAHIQHLILRLYIVQKIFFISELQIWFFFCFSCEIFTRLFLFQRIWGFFSPAVCPLVLILQNHCQAVVHSLTNIWGYVNLIALKSSCVTLNTQYVENPQNGGLVTSQWNKPRIAFHSTWRVLLRIFNVLYIYSK